MDSSSPAPLALHNSPSSTSTSQAIAPPMSARPTASSTSTATPAAVTKDEQDLNKLDISSPHELTAFVGASFLHLLLWPDI